MVKYLAELRSYAKAHLPLWLVAPMITWIISILYSHGRNATPIPFWIACAFSGGLFILMVITPATIESVKNR